MKKEDLKTRPDLTDDQYLAYLVNLPENTGIDVRGLYLDMHEWCAKKRKTPNRKRLLNWIAREREDLPMTMLPTQAAMNSIDSQNSQDSPKCQTCNDTREVPTKPKNAKYTWQVEFIPCPDCKKEVT